MAEVFETLVAVNVNGHTETKTTGGKDLTYLSWPWAWSEVKKRYPDAMYTIIRDPDTHLPYSYDPLTGYMVYTTVTIEGISHMMWLPVMDSSNKAMKSEPYTVTNKWGKTTEVEAATMFDVNKTIMRCLVKNLAMFGLGLYLYAGEDLPEGEAEEQSKKEEPKKEVPKKKSPPTAEEMKAQAVDQPVLCSHCGREIKPYLNDEGKTISVRQHVKGSRERFEGKVWCLDCIKDYLGGKQNA